MESGIVFFTAQWFTIQPDLFGRIEDEVGELGESEKDFVRICTTALNSGRFAKYRWCGNGHPPSSRVAIFKMLVLKALRNFPTTKDTLLIVRQSPVLRRLCGWESVADIPSESTVSRAYDQFAQDEIASVVRLKNRKTLRWRLDRTPSGGRTSRQCRGVCNYLSEKFSSVLRQGRENATPSDQADSMQPARTTKRTDVAGETEMTGRI